MKMYLAHGNKGGVGKSFISSALVDVILKNDPTQVVMLVEGDHTQHDVADRFQNVTNVVPYNAQLNNPKKGFETLTVIMSELMEQVGQDLDNVSVVINTPAGFSDTFDSEAQSLLKEICEAFDAEFTIIYCIGDTYVAQKEAMDFMVSNETGAKVVLALQAHLLDRVKLEADYADLIESGDAFIVDELTEYATSLYLGHEDKSLVAISKHLESEVANMGNKIRVMSLNKEIDKIHAKLDAYVLNKNYSKPKKTAGAAKAKSAESEGA